MQKISRQKNVEGTTISGIIHNGQYFYTNIEIYEDGMIHCWELVDLNGLKEKIASGWLVSQIPNGKNVSIHGLGTYGVASAEWKFDRDEYEDYIHTTIKKLNPTLTNIYKIAVEEKALWEKRRVVVSPQPTEFYVKKEISYETVQGDSFTIFMKHKNQNILVNLVMYKDGNIVCYAPNIEVRYTVKEIQALFNDGTFFTHFKKPTKIVLGNLGTVTLNEAVDSVEIHEKYKELLDMYAKLQGNEDSLEKCRRVYYEYLEYPSEEGKKRLKELYEAIPEHERMYLGDMESRDSDYRRIIYSNSTREV